MVPVRTEGTSSYEDVANFQTLQHAELWIAKLKTIPKLCVFTSIDL